MLDFRRVPSSRIVTFCMLCAAGIGIAADNPLNSTAPAVSAAQDLGDHTAERGTGPAAEPSRAPRQDVITVALLVVAGIAAAGLFLMGLTILWGGRLRRLARRPLPEQSPIDELWYLKPPKQRPGDAVGQREPDGPTAPQSPQEPSESS